MPGCRPSCLGQIRLRYSNKNVMLSSGFLKTGDDQFVTSRFRKISAGCSGSRACPSGAITALACFRQVAFLALLSFLDDCVKSSDQRTGTIDSWILTVWIQTKGLLQRSLRLFQLSLAQKCFAKVRLDGGIIWLQFRSFGQIGIGGVKISRLPSKSYRPCAGEPHVVRSVQRRSAPEQRVRGVELALLILVVPDGHDRLYLIVRDSEYVRRLLAGLDPLCQLNRCYLLLCHSLFLLRVISGWFTLVNVLHRGRCRFTHLADFLAQFLEQHHHFLHLHLHVQRLLHRRLHLGHSASRWIASAEASEGTTAGSTRCSPSAGAEDVAHSAPAAARSATAKYVAQTAQHPAQRSHRLVDDVAE